MTCVTRTGAVMTCVTRTGAVMTCVTRVLILLLCAAGCHLTSEAERPPLVVMPGHDASLTCNLTSPDEVTWYRVTSRGVQLLLTVRRSKLGGEDMEDVHAKDVSRLSVTGNVSGGEVALRVRAARPSDGGLYFCSGRCAGAACVHAGVHLAVSGADGAADTLRAPCWTAIVCAAAGLLAVCGLGAVGLYLCSGTRVPWRRNGSEGRTQEDTLQYSSLKLPPKPRPSAGRGGRLVDRDVIYSTVANQKSPRTSRDLP